MSDTTPNPAGLVTTAQQSRRSAVFLGSYLVILAASALVAAFFFWPNSKALSTHIQHENELKLKTKITAESFQKLYAALDGVNRWQLYGPAQLTEKDKAAIQTGLQLAGQLGAVISPAQNLAPSGSSASDVQKTKPKTSDFSFISITTKDKAFTAVNLQQGPPIIPDPLLIPIPILIPLSLLIPVPTPSKVFPVGTDISLPPISGDLRLVTARTLANAMDALRQAIIKLQQRETFMESHPELQAIHMFPTNIPSLTSSEEVDFQNQLTQLIDDENELVLKTPKFNLLFITIMFGILGGAVKCLASLAQHLGEKTFETSWNTYYFAHPLIGGAVGLIFILLVRGGFLQDVQTGNGSLMSTCAIAALVGMFSDEATKKLGKIASALFSDNTAKKDTAATNGQNPAILGASGGDLPELTNDHISHFEPFAKQFKDAVAILGPVPEIGQINNQAQLTLFLARKLNQFTIDLLNQYASGENLVLQHALINDLNEVIKSEKLYLTQLFNTVNSPTVAKLIHQALTSASLAVPETNLSSETRSLNRILLTQAYPESMVTWAITLLGRNFRSDTAVQLNGQTVSGDEIPTYLSTGALELKLKLANHEPGNVSIVLSNPDPQGGQSAAFDILLS